MQITISANRSNHSDAGSSSSSSSSSPPPMASSGPCRHGDGNSAPTTPGHSSPAVCMQIDDDLLVSNSSSSYENEEKCISTLDADFEFSCSLLLEKTEVASADELFDGGKIRLLKPSPSYHSTAISIPPSHSTSPPEEKLSVRVEDEMQNTKAKQATLCQRGREREKISYSCCPRKETRSFSPPPRVSGAMSETDETVQNQETSYTQEIDAPSPLSSCKSHKQWNLKNLLLFRSASEGRSPIKTTGLRNNGLLPQKESMEDIHDIRFRSVDGTRMKMRELIAAHDKHYSLNRVIAEEMKRKTMLPHGQGLLGCLGFYNGPPKHE